MKLKNKIQKMGVISIVFLFSASVLAGCGDEKTRKPETRETISLWHYWESNRMQRALEDVVNEFNSSQDEIEVEMQYIPDEDFKKQLALSMADNRMPELALVDSSDFQYFHAMHPFVDLTAEIEGIEEFLPEAKASCEIDGKMMGLPVGLNCTVLYYNIDMFEQAGAEVPQTVDEMYDAAVQVSGEGKYGFLVSALQSEESMYSFLPILWANGGNVDSVNSSESRHAFSLLRSMVEAGAMSRQAINLNADDLTKQFADGKIAMMMTASSSIDSVREINPALRFDITYPPGNEDGTHYSVIGGEIFGVTQGEHQEAAIKFLKFFSQSDRILKFQNQCGLMSPIEETLRGQYEDDESKRKQKDILKCSRAREFSEEWPSISQVFTWAMEEEIIAQREEQEILDEAAELIAKIREGNL